VPVELTTKVAFLRQPKAYLDRPAQVEAIETHRSWVFLTELYAYKLKKPARSPSVDYSTLAARSRYCAEELVLNKRLAPDVYLAVVPLVLGARGLEPVAAASGEPASGEVVDWLVLMRRLPRERLLDWQIAHKSVNERELRAAVAWLIDFYARAERVSWSGRAYRLRIEREVLRYRSELEAPRFDLGVDSLDQITTAQIELLHREPELFDARARAGRIVDGHGDLRPEHVVLGAEPRVIDCLEFDRELRLLDSASEIAFLSLECARLGAPELGVLIRESYAELSGDHASDRLIDFYESHHACVRAAVALWHLDDPALDSSSVWVDKARAYLSLAFGRLQGMRPYAPAGAGFAIEPMR
jgi:aminoglycoside phosphotransferase family enzyme